MGSWSIMQIFIKICSNYRVVGKENSSYTALSYYILARIYRDVRRRQQR
jgi:hypothetical protein